MRADSPLRYPGGKASYAGFLRKVIEANRSPGVYCEPFAGGAGAALRLLRMEVVSEIYLNDVDPRIFAFWRAVLEETERLKKKIRGVTLDVDEWDRQSKILRDRRHLANATFELGFAALYLNRCNRSGIIAGAAPIGGYNQTGPWGIGARFNPRTLVERISWLEEQRERIHLSNKDAIQFLEQDISGMSAEVFVYLDPPYFRNGHRLYSSSYHPEDHRRLARYMRERDDLMWIMSYDDAGFIRDLYGDFVRDEYRQRYSLQDRRVARELVIAPTHVALPHSGSETAMTC